MLRIFKDIIAATLFLFVLTDVYGEELPVQVNLIVDSNSVTAFHTLNEAIAAVPDFCSRETVIHLAEGIYREHINIPPSKRNLKLVGKGMGKTIISGNCSARLIGITGVPVGTSGTATFINAAIGFAAEYITFENTADRNAGQAVALLCMGDKQRYIHCHIKGNHDTLFLYGGGNRPETETCQQNGHYLFEDCMIEGTTDFIFGSATAYFSRCTILSKKNSYITAASTYKGQRFGFVFNHCRFVAAEGVSRVYLGRPWRIYAQTVVLNSEMGDHIRPEGWYDWYKPQVRNGTTFYAEYNNYGPGALGQRVSWSKRLSSQEAEIYTCENVYDE